MACASLTALPRACGTEGIVAGLEKLYMISFSDLTIGDDGKTYTIAENGMVSDISVTVAKLFTEVGLLKSTAGLNEALTKNAQNGTAFFTQTFTLVLSDLTVENKKFVESVLNQPVAILIRTRTGKYFTTGLNGQFELATLEGGTGIAEGDLTGYTLTFTGIDTKLVPQVDPTIVASLLVAAVAP